MPIGFHTSIAGGLPMAVGRAVGIGCDAMQIFGRNPRSWAWSGMPEDAEAFRKKREEAGLWPVAVHTTYLINLSSPDREIHGKSVSLFCNELRLANALGADFLVTHLGSSRGTGPEAALGRIGEALRLVADSGAAEPRGQVKSRKQAGGAKGAGPRPGGRGGPAGTMILFENSAGGGDSYGCSLAEIGRAMEAADSVDLAVGLCFDTAHAFASGYPFRDPEEAAALVRTIEDDVGLERLRLVHLNDSKAAFLSRVDRHEHIGKGRIGLKGFRALLARPEFSGVPLILETPKESDEDDRRNLRTVRRILSAHGAEVKGRARGAGRPKG